MISYPKTRRNEALIEKHGYTIEDAYTHLEDPNSPETIEFVKAQNELTQSILSKSTLKEKFKKTLTALMDYPKAGCPQKEGNHYFYFYNSGLQPQSVLMRIKSLEDAKPEVFFDPNTLAEDGTISLSTYSFSESGKFFCHALSESGSDWVKVHVKSVETGENLKDILKWVKFTSLSWTHDDKGFFYKQYPKPVSVGEDKAGTETDSNTGCSLYYHLLGTDQKDDAKVYTDPDSTAHPSVTISEDGKYIVLIVSLSCDPNSKVYISPIDEFLKNYPNPPVFKCIVDNYDNAYSYLTSNDSIFYFETTLDAPKKRIVKYDFYAPEKGFQEVVKETKDVIDFVAVVAKSKLVVCRLQEVKHVVTVYDLYTGANLYDLPLPVGSIINSLSGKRKDNTMFYKAASYLSPGTIYKFNFEKQEQTVFKETDVKGLKSNDLVTKQVFYESKDGTKVPMYIFHRKDLVLDGSNPTLLYGYGGFNISITPSFSASWITFAQHMGGVVAVANIRGGSEYGNEWYYNGRLDKKQNVFDDFIYAGKYLVKENFTNHSKICINGGSNGGLLVGACLNQGPDQFGIGIAEVGVLDMLKFHKFTIGHAWVSDYGDPEKKEDFETLLKYSPLHNVKKNQAYPAVMILTGDHDDRVVPLHSLKFLAQLQHYAKNDSSKPILGRIETKAGHGAGKTTAQRIEEASDKFAFIGIQFGIRWCE